MTLADKPTTRKTNGAATAAPFNPDAIVNAVNDTPVPVDEFVSSSGLKFKLKKVSAMLISEAGRKVVRPHVPVVYIEDKQREEENPNDPDYIAAQREADWQTTILTINVTIAFGTVVIEETIPKDIEHWDDTSWSDTMAELLDLEIPKGGRARYAAWIKFYALPDHQELLDLQRAIARFSGNVPEEDVTSAEDSFRNNEERDTAEGIPTQEEV